MRKLVSALIIPARLNEQVRVERIEAAMAIQQSLVEGNVEASSGRGWHVLLNDQAIHIPLPPNPRAEVLIREAGTPMDDTVSGTAVFLGHGSSGTAADVPSHLLSLAERLFETRLAA
ncbi:DUF3846 domain-containing protein [Paenarthrobacter nitroguajacolicus]|uniref:DUF3846 domain-containing protein n=1 Tax=Paenarthrobacter nitroguajacolicus TaxID=211146 RepID=UPI00347FEBE0